MIESVLGTTLAVFSVFAPAAMPMSTPDAVPSVPPSTIESVRLERMGCYGMCPKYTVIFWNDGTAVYHGERFVDKIGTFYGKSDFAVVTAWLDAQHVDEYAGEYAVGWLDAEGMRLTINRPGGHATTIYTQNTTYLPWQIQGIVAGIDGFGDRVRWQDVSKLDPAMGYFYFKDHDKEFYQIDVYPGGAPGRLEAVMEDDEAGPSGTRSISSWYGRASLAQMKRLDAFEGNAVNIYASDAHQLRIVAKNGGLTVTMGGKTHAFARGCASQVQQLGATFFDSAMGIAQPQPSPSGCP